jgi:hypothetical protein
MEPYQLLDEEEIRTAFRQGGEAVLALFGQISHNSKLLAAILSANMQALEDRLSKNSNNRNKPPSSDGLKKTFPINQETPRQEKRRTAWSRRATSQSRWASSPGRNGNP